MKNTHLSAPRLLRDCAFTSGSTSGPAARSGYGFVWWLAISLCCTAAAVVIALSEQTPPVL